MQVFNMGTSGDSVHLSVYLDDSDIRLLKLGLIDTTALLCGKQANKTFVKELLDYVQQMVDES